MIRFLLFLIITLILPATNSFATEVKELRFTAIPDQDTQRLQVRFAKVAAYLEQKLQVKVTYIPVKSYAASVSAFKNDEVQLAWFGGLSGVQARASQRGAKAIAQGREDQEFETYFIANRSTGLKYGTEFPIGIQGKTFTFGSKGSTSGRLMPEYYIRQHFKQAPRKVFHKVGFSGDHSKTIALVQSGAYQVGAVNYQVYLQAIKEGKIDLKKVVLLWKTPQYPDYNWTVRGDLDQRFGKGFTDQIQQALLEMKEPELLSAFPRSGFISANNELYLPILKTGTEIGLLRE